ncbi:MAG: alkaline phosphatase family protein, partial [Candidatus Bipolaricaulia bacterium]
KSTIPPITGAAWTSFQTGLNPGRHGLFDWLTREEGSYRLRPIGSQMIEEPRRWDYAGEQGGRVGIVGVPVTYPPRQVAGFLISGILTPQGASYTYPEELARELEVNVGKFPFMPEHWQGRREARGWLARLRRSIERRTRIAQYLIKKYDPDLFMLHIMETDSVQHQLWHLLDGVARPRYRVALEGNPVLEIYREVDAALGVLLGELPEGTTLFIISDHGFGPLYWNVYLNMWLLREGYLVLKRGAGAGLKRTAFRLGVTQERLFPWAERLGLLKRGAGLRHGQIHDLLGKFFLSFGDVDWRRTRAYSYGNIGQIYLNREGREPEGIVKEGEADLLIEELSAGLSTLRNPDNGEPVIERVYRKEELYHGKRLDQAPEILFLPRRGYMTLGTTDFPANRVVTPTFAGSGWHEMEGVLIAAGGGLRRGEIRGVRLIDLCPTILYAMGLAVPRGLDGEVIEKLFTEDHLRENPVEYTDKEVVRADLGGEERGEWEEEIRRRLQDLGYI